MRLIKMTGGLGNQMFIYALYISMKQRGLNACIDLSDMMHYHCTMATRCTACLVCHAQS